MWITLVFLAFACCSCSTNKVKDGNNKVQAERNYGIYTVVHVSRDPPLIIEEQPTSQFPTAKGKCSYSHPQIMFALTVFSIIEQGKTYYKQNEICRRKNEEIKTLLRIWE